MKEMNREMELNMDELEQVNGGGDGCVCILLGASTRVDAAACYGSGSSKGDTSEGLGVNACAFVGFGFGIFA